MQSATNEAVTAIGDVGKIIVTISEISQRIAAAVEEQSAVTQEITSNMGTAATGVQAISENMSKIVASTRSASDATRQVREASLALAS